MASKPTPKKSSAKKPAPVVKKSAFAPMPASKPAPKPAAKTPAAPVSKAAPAPAAKPVSVVNPAPVAVTPPPAPKPAPAPKELAGVVTALSVSAQSSQGAAASGNTHPANILIIVTSAGAPVVDLNRDNFTLMEHFEVPGQGAPFSNNITSFRNAGTGAYLLQTKPINGAPWRTGHHLGQLLVSTEERQGQTALKIIIR